MGQFAGRIRPDPVVRKRGKALRHFFGGAELERIRADYAQFLEHHPRLQKARARFHSAQRLSPATALDYYSRMLELVEEEFGGRKTAEAALGAAPTATAPPLGVCLMALQPRLVCTRTFRPGAAMARL